jgi:hypothetical protein
VSDNEHAAAHTSFWWADATYLGPGLWFRQRRLLPVPLVLLRPRYWWRVRR